MVRNLAWDLAVLGLGQPGLAWGEPGETREGCALAVQTGGQVGRQADRQAGPLWGTSLSRRSALRGDLQWQLRRWHDGHDGQGGQGGQGRQGRQGSRPTERTNERARIKYIGDGAAAVDHGRVSYSACGR